MASVETEEQAAEELRKLVSPTALAEEPGAKRQVAAKPMEDLFAEEPRWVKQFRAETRERELRREEETKMAAGGSAAGVSEEPVTCGASQIVCPNPNCGYRGEPKRMPKGSPVVAVVLCLAGLLPGLLYLVFMSGHRYSCPNCGMQIGTDGGR